jgi:2-polyprenyl-3-methyl-5-hydroxy-6-metoxy-1,4-benzoquinol methylase
MEPQNLTNRENIGLFESMPVALIENFGDEGDFARRFLLNPVLFRLLGEVKDRKILDAGCGQGYLSRLLAKRGARVTGLEPTGVMLDYAIERERREKLGITYIRADLSDYSQLSEKFDTVVSNMVLMDIPDYERAIANCLALLEPGGHFIFSISHPCFENSHADFMRKGFCEVREYLADYLIKQDYGYRVHRPLSAYLNTVIRCGGALLEVVEPRLNRADLPEDFPENERDLHVPSFMVIHAQKTGK